MPKGKQGYRILVVVADRSLLSLIGKTLRPKGFQCVAVSGGEQRTRKISLIR